MGNCSLSLQTYTQTQLAHLKVLVQTQQFSHQRRRITQVSVSVLWGHMDLQAARRILCVLIIVRGRICVPSKGDRLLHYCRSSVDFYQRHTAGCNIKYLSEVMLTLAMSFLYGAKDKIDSSIKLRLFCTIMIRLFTHYRKSQHLKKVLL